MGGLHLLDYYKFIRNSTQLVDVWLHSVHSEKKDGGDKRLGLRFSRDVVVVNETQAELTLDVEIDFEGEGPFSISVVYKGTCEALEDITPEELQRYAYDQVVPLLLPYAREYISDTLRRMSLPIFTIPTMDVLRSLSENDEESIETDDEQSVSE